MNATTTRRLVRNTDDKVIGGVASGLASYFDIDPVIVRVVFVVATVTGGFGLLVYLALWVLTPAGSVPEPPRTSERSTAFWVAIGLLVLGGLALADQVADRSIVWPLLLIGAGVALWRSEPRAERVPAVAGGGTTATTPPHPNPAVEAAHEALADSSDVVVTEPAFVDQVMDEVRADLAAERARPPKPPSVLGRVTVAIALLSIGLLTALDRMDVLTLDASTAIAVALLVVGGGLLVGAFVGRARILILPAVLVLVPGLLATTAIEDIDVNLAAGAGERMVSVRADDTLAATYEHGVGQFVLDLSQTDFVGQTLATDASIGIGELIVVVPDDVTVTVDYRVALGELALFGEDADGYEVTGAASFGGTEGAGRLHLDATVGLGRLEVVRAADAPDDRMGRSLRSLATA